MIMGYYIYDNAVILMEDTYRATHIADISHMPLYLFREEITTRERLEEVLIEENRCRRENYKSAFCDYPPIEIGIKEPNSLYTVSLYGESVYTEFNSGNRTIDPNLQDRIKNILLQRDYLVTTKYRKLSYLLPIKVLANNIYRIGLPSESFECRDGLIYKTSSNMFKNVGRSLYDIFDTQVIDRFKEKNNIACIGSDMYASIRGAAYTYADFRRLVKDLNKCIFLLPNKNIVIEGDRIKYNDMDFLIKSAPSTNKWFINGDFKGILSMFGVKTRAELNAFISLRLGAKRRDGLFPFCDSKEEIIQLVKSIPNE